MNRIPLVDLQAAHAEVAEEVEAGFKRVIAETAFIGGAEVAAFEREYAAFTGVAHCVGVANGTDALELALRAVGVGPGDEVILPANTFIATAEAVVRAGARPVLVDCDPATYLIDVDAALAAVSPATRAVVAGAPLRPDGRRSSSSRRPRRHRRAPSSRTPPSARARPRHGRRSPGAGGIAATSFYPGKNLGAYGDAGAVRHRRRGAGRRRCARCGSHGGLNKYVHDAGRRQLPARHAAGRRAAGQAGPARAPGTRPGGPPRPATTSCSPDCRRGPAGDARRATSTSGTSTWCGCRATARQPARRGAGQAERRRHRRRASTTRSRST